MKKKIKCFIAYLLVLEILICELRVGVTHVRAQENKDESSVTMETSTNSVAEKEDAEIKVSYQLTSQWENHYNVDVTLGNITDELIDNWEICIPANYEIENKKSIYNFIAMRKSGQKTDKSALRTQYFAGIDLIQIKNLVKE